MVACQILFTYTHSRAADMSSDAPPRPLGWWETIQAMPDKEGAYSGHISQVAQANLRNTMRGFLSTRDVVALSNTSKQTREDVLFGGDTIVTMQREGHRIYENMRKEIQTRVEAALIEKGRKDPRDRCHTINYILTVWQRVWASADGNLLLGYMSSGNSREHLRFMCEIWLSAYIVIINELAVASNDPFRELVDTFTLVKTQFLYFFTDLERSTSYVDGFRLAPISTLMALFCPRATNSSGNYLPPLIEYTDALTWPLHKVLFFMRDTVYANNRFRMTPLKKTCVLNSIRDGYMTVDAWTKAASVKYTVDANVTLPDPDEWINNMAVVIVSLCDKYPLFPDLKQLIEAFPAFMSVRNLTYIRDVARHGQDIMECTSRYYWGLCPLLMVLWQWRLFNHWVPEARCEYMQDAMAHIRSHPELANRIRSTLQYHYGILPFTAQTYVPSREPYTMWNRHMYKPTLEELESINAFRETLKPKRDDLFDGSVKKKKVDA